MATFKPVCLSGGKHLKLDGTTNIKIRIYHNGSAQYIPTSHYVSPKLLGNDGFVSPQTPEAELLNYDITETIQKYRKTVLNLGTHRTNRMTASELKEYLIKADNIEAEFIDFVEFSRKVISQTPKAKTAEWYECSLSSFMKFFNKKRIDIKDVNVRNLDKYIKHLSETKIIIEKKDKKTKNITRTIRAMEPGTVNNYLRGLRALYNKAKKYYNDEDLDIIKIPYNPFDKISIPQYRRKRKNLSIEQIIRIKNHEYQTERANMARDVFMMMFYLMGININDLYKITHESGGRVMYERSKTKTDIHSSRFPLSIKIEPELRMLFDKYSNGEPLSHFRARYCNLNNFMRAVNTGLKQISEELHLDIPPTTNWARHSWASIARNKAGISKADIDFCLGHVNNDYKMADIYIEIDYSICDKTNRAVLDLLKEKRENNRDMLAN